MSWIIADIKSFFPLSQAPVANKLQVGENAPSFKADRSRDGEAAGSLEYPLTSGKPSVVVFVRHLGCPFCQQTIQERLIPLARKHEGIDFFLVSQADTETTKDYLTKLPVEGDLTNPPFSIISSPEPHSLYSTWGISQLSLSSVINMDILGSVKDLAREKNIKNTLTVGSRWLNSGGFAVDKEGKIVWTHVAERSDDVSDLDAAVKALGI